MKGFAAVAIAAAGLAALTGCSQHQGSTPATVQPEQVTVSSTSSWSPEDQGAINSCEKDIQEALQLSPDILFYEHLSPTVGDDFTAHVDGYVNKMEFHCSLGRGDVVTELKIGGIDYTPDTDY